jgi:UDP-glucuronate 4-epimerase
MKNILLLGGNGYVGSFLNYKFKNIFNIKNIDLNWFIDNEEKVDYNALSKEYINNFDSVILLAGHSSVKMCDNDMLSSFNNNIKNFINLLTKINKSQKFIYASSSSVYGNTQKSVVSETYNNFDPYNYYDLTKQIIDSYAQKTELNYYGLRFGTVNGWSPHLRTDIMINSMTYCAVEEKHIKLYIKDISRAILGIDDLANSIKAIIDCNKNNSGIYNIASFNDTAENIAKDVSQICNVPVVEYDLNNLDKIKNVKVQLKAYDFSIDTTKFEKTFNFKFKDTTKNITRNLLLNYNNCIKTSRNENINYE